MSAEPRLREGIRGLIMDPDDHVLLVRFHWDGIDPPDGFWANPGGGREGTETRLDTLRRELREETGLIIDDLGTEVWTKTALFPMTHWDGQVDHIHLVRTEHFDPVPEMSTAQLASEGVHEIRWWSPDEIAGSDATFAPRSLPELIMKLRRDGVPATPVELTGF